MNGWGILLEILITDFRFGGFGFGFWLMNVKMSVSEVVFLGCCQFSRSCVRFDKMLCCVFLFDLPKDCC